MIASCHSILSKNIFNDKRAKAEKLRNFYKFCQNSVPVEEKIPKYHLLPLNEKLYRELKENCRIIKFYSLLPKDTIFEVHSSQRKILLKVK